MEYKFIIAKDRHFDNSSLMVDVPEQCPICEKNMIPCVMTDVVIVSDHSIKKTVNCDIYQASFITRCTHCFRLYTNIFEIYPDYSCKPHLFKDVYFETKMPSVNVKLPELINSVSPKFVKIYKQALQAEKLNLDELAGMGLRKAIEFLVKDYAIKNNRENEQEIKSQNLGNTINKFIDDDNLQALAEGATWIANDETHYATEWPNKDIEDIKKYIECFIGHIELKSNIADIQNMREERKKRKEQKKQNKIG